MISLKTQDDLVKLRKANALVSATLFEVGQHILPGVSTKFLNDLAEDFIRSHGGIPSFLGFPSPFGSPFPGSLCTSVNHVVAHGIPSEREILRSGDIISVDCGVFLDGFHGDSCYTFCVGDVAPEVRDLLITTRNALYLGIEKAVAGAYISDIGHAIQQYCESRGYGVVRELTGHGIGTEMHEDPQVPNYGKPGSGVQLQEGMCIAIEPMITMGDKHIALLPDKWGIVTRDGSVSAHFEHSIAITNGKAEILSTFKEIEKAKNLWQSSLQ